MPLDSEMMAKRRTFVPAQILNIYVTIVEPDDQSGLLRICGVLGKENIALIETKINDHKDLFDSGHMSLDPSQVSPGTPCCAKYSEDGNWYRARVTRVSTVGQTQTATLFYVDYGNHESGVPFANLRLPINSLKSIEDQTNKFLMANVSCGLNGWTEEAISFCDDKLGQELVWAVVLGHNHDGVPIIKVHQQEGSVPFHKTLVEKGYGIGFDVLDCDEAVAPGFGYKCPTVRMNSKVPVCVSHVRSAEDFFVRDVEQCNNNESRSILELSSPEGWRQLATCETIETGLTCLLFNSSGHVCRGMVVDVDMDTGMCRVFLVDFGDMVTEPAFNLRLCPDKYKTFAAQAIHCRFDSEQSGRSDADARFAFLNELRDSGQIVRCVFKRCLRSSGYAVTLTKDIPQATPQLSYERLSPLICDSYLVEMISVPNPEVFLVSLVKYQPMREVLVQKIAQFMRHASNRAVVRPEHAVTGTPCLILCTESMIWYRGEIIGAANNIDQIVSFVDTGEVDVIDRNALQVISPELVSFIPAQAITCTPHLIEPEPAMKEKTKRAMINLMSGKQIVAKVIGHTSKKHNVVELYDTTVEPHIFINLHLRYLKKDPTVIVKPPSVDKVESVFISSYESGSFFFCQMMKFSEDLLNMMSADIEKRYEHLKSYEKVLLVEDGRLKSGQFCCAPYESKYYRAVVLDHPAPGLKVEVLFIDYGNKTKVDMCDVKRLDPDLAICPAIGIVCSIVQNYSYVTGDLAPLVKKTLEGSIVVIEVTSTNSDGSHEVKFVKCPENEEVLVKLKAYGLTLREDDMRPYYQRLLAQSGSSCPTNGKNPMSTDTNQEATNRPTACDDGSNTSPQTNGFGPRQGHRASTSSLQDETASRRHAGSNGNVDEAAGWDSRHDQRNVPNLNDCSNTGYVPFVPPRMQRVGERFGLHTGTDQNVSNGGIDADEPGTNSWNPDRRRNDYRSRSSDGHEQSSGFRHQRDESAQQRGLASRNSDFKDDASDKSDQWKPNDQENVREVPNLRPMKIDVDSLASHIVKVTCIVNPRDFHCQFTAFGEELKNISEEMQRHYSQSRGGGRFGETVTVGSPCCCKFSLDEQWYRAIVVKQLKNDTFIVRYVDYGNEETKSRKEIEPLDAKFCWLPMIAVRCCLQGVGTSGPTWSAARNADFENRVFDVVFVATFVSMTREGGYEVLLHPTSKPPELSLNYKIMKDELLSPSDPDDVIYKAMLYDSFENPFTVLRRVQFNRAEPVAVSWVVNFGLFYVQLGSSAAVLHELLVRCSQLSSRSSAQPLNFDSGTPCLAIYREGSYLAWCRAVVVRSCDSSVYVFFVDYGNIANVQKADVRGIHQELLDVPAQAIPCCFGGVAPVDLCWPMPKGDGKNVTKYFGGGNIECQFLGRLGRSYVVDFLVDGLPVTPRLISDGVLAMSTANIPVIPLESDIQIDGNLATIYEEADSGKSSDSTPVKSADRSVESCVVPSAESEATHPIVQDGKRIGVIVSHANSPADFYVQKTSDLDALASFLTEIFEACDGSEELDRFPESASVCAAQMADDENWYRADVLSTDEEGISVRFIDYGNEAVVPPSQVRKLSKSLQDVPKYALPCRLYGLKLDSPLPVETTNSFTDLADNATELCAEFVVERDDAKCTASTAIRLFDQEGNNVQTSIGIPDDCLESRPTLKMPGSIQCGRRIEVYVTHIVSPSDFWIQKDEDSAVLNEIQESLDLLGAEEKSIDDNNEIAVGDAVAAKYSIDEVWYRALILEAADDGFRVRFVDFGNEDVVPSANIRPLSETHLQVPCLAFECTLHGIEEPADGVYTQEATDLFAELAADSKLLAEIIGREDKGRHVISLLDMGINLASMLSESNVGVVAVGGTNLNALLSESSALSDLDCAIEKPTVQPDERDSDCAVFECEPEDMANVSMNVSSFEENDVRVEEKLDGRTQEVSQIDEPTDPENRSDQESVTKDASEERTVIEKEILEERSPQVVELDDSDRENQSDEQEDTTDVTKEALSEQSFAIGIVGKTPEVTKIYEIEDPEYRSDEEESITNASKDASFEERVVIDEESVEDLTTLGRTREVVQIDDSDQENRSDEDMMDVRKEDSSEQGFAIGKTLEVTEIYEIEDPEYRSDEEESITNAPKDASFEERVVIDEESVEDLTTLGRTREVVEIDDSDQENRSDKDMTDVRKEALSEQSVLIEENLSGMTPEVSVIDLIEDSDSECLFDNENNGHTDGENSVLEVEAQKEGTQRIPLAEDVVVWEEKQDVSALSDMYASVQDEIGDSDERECWDDAREDSYSEIPKIDCGLSEVLVELCSEDVVIDGPTVEVEEDDPTDSDTELVDDMLVTDLIIPEDLAEPNRSDDDKAARGSFVAIGAVEVAVVSTEAIAVADDGNTESSPVVQEVVVEQDSNPIP